MSDAERKDRRALSRRDVLWIGTGVGIGLAGASLFVIARDLRPPPSTTPQSVPLRKGDQLVFAQGSRKGSAITVDRVPTGGPPLLSWPMDPESNTVRSSRALNLVVLVRAGAESWYSPSARARTVSGVAAYSGTCTHLCCDVSDWASGKGPHGLLLCPCHRSHFDPWGGGRVLDGPAPRPLPILPIETDHAGRLVVAGDFLTFAGCKG